MKATSWSPVCSPADQNLNSPVFTLQRAMVLYTPPTGPYSAVGSCTARKSVLYCLVANLSSSLGISPSRLTSSFGSTRESAALRSNFQRT